MRILSITAQKPHSTGSGVYLTELVKGFAAMGHEQAVVAGITREDSVCFPPNISFYPVYYHTEALPFPIAGMSDEMPYESTIYSHMTPQMVALFKSAFLEKITQAVVVFQPDLILCHHLYLLTALVREQFPAQRVVGICHGTGLRQIQKNALERPYILEQIRKLDRITALHTAQKQAVVERYGIPPEKIAVVGSGYNDRIFRALSFPRNQATLLYAGKLSEKKGVLSLLKCLEQVRLPTLTVKLAGGAGNDREYREIRTLATRCPYPVEFLGRLDQEGLAQEMNRCELFVLPSFYEGLPLVLIEALACGMKILSTDLPGVRDWMDAHIPGNGATYVALPTMVNADEPDPDALPLFEQQLARAIEQSVPAKKNGSIDLTAVSWQGVCAQILAAGS